MLKKIPCILLVMAMIISVFPPISLSASDGLTFGKGYYSMKDSFSTTPLTFEASIKLPKTVNDRGGVIVGSFVNNTTQCINFEIYTNGAPRLYYRLGSSLAEMNVVFSGVDVRGDDFIHLAIVIDPENLKAHCYIDGELKESKSISYFVSEPLKNPLHVGGDRRSDNAQYFKGTIETVSVFSDMRSADEIGKDAKAIPSSEESLMVSYDLKNALTDLSGNGNDLLKNGGNWFNDCEEVTDYEYSFCIIGDTQKMVYDDAVNGNNNTDKLYDWIVDNAENEKIAYVFGLGDMTDMDYESEWAIVKKNVMKLNSVVPYSLVKGNHDSSARFNQYFRSDSYVDQLDGQYQKFKIENTYRTIRIGSVDYLIFTLDYGASDAVLNWASEIIEAHPTHRVIITTHAYLFRDGTTIGQNDICPPATTGGYNNGDDIWDKLVSKHENIFLVISGHDPSDKVVVTRALGRNKNTVTQILVDPQGVDAREGPTGMITMLYFGNDGRTVTVRTYSTVNEAYFMEDNQFSFKVPKYDPQIPEESTSVSTTEPESQTQTSQTTQTEASESVNSNLDNGKNADYKVFIIAAAVTAVAVVTVVSVAVIKRKGSGK